MIEGLIAGIGLIPSVVMFILVLIGIAASMGAGITEMGTTYNLPNYVGELFALTREDTPFLSTIGGLTGGKRTTATLFQWQTYDLRAAAQNVALEGAAAPTAQARVRANVSNVVEIHQEAVDVSYTKLAATGQFNSTGSDNAGSVGINGQNPVLNELSWQTTQTLKQISRDVNFGFLQGTFVNPANNSTARKTRGIIEAITTNVYADSGVLTEDAVLDLMQMTWENGGIRESETRTIVVNAGLKRDLTKIFITDKDYQESSRNVGGVNLKTIETDFGTTNIMMDAMMPVDTLLVCSLEQCAPVILEIPGKGFLFIEPLAKVGANEHSQIYGEIGLEYGAEKSHGKITGLTPSTSVQS